MFPEIWRSELKLAWTHHTPHLLPVASCIIPPEKNTRENQALRRGLNSLSRRSAEEASDSTYLNDDRDKTLWIRLFLFV